MGKKKILLGLLSVLLLIGGWFFVEDRKKKEAQALETRRQIVEQLAQVQEEQDKKIFDQQASSIKEALQQRQTELEKVIQDTIQDDLDSGIQGLSSSKRQLELLTSLYAATADASLLPALFQISLDLREFDNALQYLSVLQKTPGLDTDLDVHQYLYALFNADEVTFSSLGRFRKVIEQYETNGLITTDDKNFYFSLLALTRGDIAGYKQLIEKLKNTSYSERADLYKKANDRYTSFVDTPEYYLKGLLSIGLFQEGWYRSTQHVSRDILSEDPRYVLAFQLNAYASLMLGERNEAIQSLEYLKTHDAPQRELYLYLAGISLYNQERYNEAILSLKQLKEQRLNQDVLRYQYLAYEKLQDKKGMLDSLKLLISSGSLTVYDYHTIFNTLFFQETNPDFITSMQTELTSLLNACYEEIGEESVYICLYGKAGMNLSLGNTSRAYQYLSHAAQRFPTRDIYERLGDMAQTLEKEQEATKRYIKAITSTSVVDQQEGLREKIKGLME